MLIEELNQLFASIKIDFYQRLINGDIEKAKESLFFIVGYAYDLQNRWLNEKRNISNIDPNKIKEVDEIIVELCNKINDLNNISKKQLENLNNKEFAEDQKTWKILLAEEFEQIVNEILELIYATKEKLLIIEKETQKEQKLKQEFTSEYTRRKQKVKTYSTNIDIIKRIENRIIEKLSNNDFSQTKITGKIKTGPWTNYLHAHLPMPLGDHRIVYSYDGRKVVFHVIGTHKELRIN